MEANDDRSMLEDLTNRFTFDMQVDARFAKFSLKENPDVLQPSDQYSLIAAMTDGVGKCNDAQDKLVDDYRQCPDEYHQIRHHTDTLNEPDILLSQKCCFVLTEFPLEFWTQRYAGLSDNCKQLQA